MSINQEGMVSSFGVMFFVPIMFHLECSLTLHIIIQHLAKVLYFNVILFTDTHKQMAISMQVGHLSLGELKIHDAVSCYLSHPHASCISFLPVLSLQSLSRGQIVHSFCTSRAIQALLSALHFELCIFCIIIQYDNKNATLAMHKDQNLCCCLLSHFSPL